MHETLMWFRFRFQVLLRVLRALAPVILPPPREEEDTKMEEVIFVICIYLPVPRFDEIPSDVTGYRHRLTDRTLKNAEYAAVMVL